MIYSEICNKKLKISRIALGCAGLGNLRQPISHQTAFNIVDASFSSGTNYFDTAPWYGTGLSEVRLGLALHDHQDFIISTKVGRFLVPTNLSEPDQAKHSEIFPNRYPNKVVFDYSYSAILQQYHESLLRLGKHRVDLLVIHDLEPSYQKDQLEAKFQQLFEQQGGIDALKYLKANNKITGFGAGLNCNQPKDYIQRYVQKLIEHGADFLILAGSPTLLDQGILDIPEISQIDIILASPYNSGILAGSNTFYYQQASEEIKNKVNRIKEVCDNFGVDIKAAALNYPFQFPNVKSLIAGPQSIEEVKQNLDVLTQQVPNELWLELRKQGLIK